MLEQRKSIRVFNEQSVPLADLQYLVKMASLAPSSKNKQPWDFIIIDKPELIAKFAQAHPNWLILKNVKSMILVCQNVTKDPRLVHGLVATSAATQNLLLAATNKNIASLWLGLVGDEVREKFCIDTLNLSLNLKPISLVALGYSDEALSDNKRLDDVVSYYYNDEVEAYDYQYQKA